MFDQKSFAKPKADPVQKLIFELSKLPGIGEKTATRLAYFILRQDAEYSTALSTAIENAKKNTLFCQKCLTFTDSKLCRICEDPSRDSSVICVVEKPSDIHSIENTVAFKGTYHVLHGVISPLDGVSPDDLKIRELLLTLSDKSRSAPVREVIMGINPSVEGEATSIYLSKLIRPLGIRVTRLAHGLPVGGRLEFTDRHTISKALENRLEMS